MTQLSSNTVDLLILGAGWTSTFLIPLLSGTTDLTYAATSTTGHDSTIKFTFDPSSTDDSPYRILPSARYVLITFPLQKAQQTKRLLAGYAATHRFITPRFVQLGSTGIWREGKGWIDRRSEYDGSNERAQAEDELMRVVGGCVLNLAGLWGGTRDPKNWIERVGDTRDKVAGKKSLHMIHGRDVARGLLAVLKEWEHQPACCAGQRYMLTDGFVYDWWALFVRWAEFGTRDTDNQSEPSTQAKWVFELMNANQIRALPRSIEELGRCYDSREFWTTFGLVPIRSGL